MKTSRLSIFLMSLLCVPTVFAAGPVEKRSDTYYSRLWTNSPFTTKPPPPDQGPIHDPFEDYALSAVMPLPRGGYMVVIQNKKKPDDRVTILPDQPSDFKVMEVKTGDGKPRSTTVKLSSGSKTGTVSFDEKLLVIRQVAPKNPGAPGGPGNPNNPGGVAVPGAPGAPNVVNNPIPSGNPGAPVAPGVTHSGGGLPGGPSATGTGTANTANSGGVRPPRPRVIPSQGGGGAGRR
ncbi:hypothetical protein KBB96_04780 [Luteolibacter ambystomatis]|uniref:Uncharacterized protein n=1 Tax=Luteolibacter ambystomatis TaxID=2824561 RepID=A0A975PFT2_9BACT|nr:hypothetical protein [Luteolibacter ambystomatis]QUE52208.1 hypothetical protein KBB96_04780 [Luteolibacter ambystomatis]